MSFPDTLQLVTGDVPDDIQLLIHGTGYATLRPEFRARTELQNITLSAFSEGISIVGMSMNNPSCQTFPYPTETNPNRSITSVVLFPYDYADMMNPAHKVKGGYFLEKGEITIGCFPRGNTEYMFATGGCGDEARKVLLEMNKELKKIVNGVMHRV